MHLMASPMKDCKNNIYAALNLERSIWDLINLNLRHVERGRNI